MSAADDYRAEHSVNDLASEYFAKALLGEIGSGSPTASVVFPTPQHVIVDSGTVDISDDAGRILGHVTIDNTSITVAFAAPPHVIVDSMPTLTADVAQDQRLDTNNTKAVTSSDASPGSPWIGTATQTRSTGVIGIFLNIISSSPVGGTYTFEFGENGTTWPISISAHSDDFSTIRYRQLLNVGEYFRVKFEPDLALGSDIVYVTTQLATQLDPSFVVPVGHSFEESEATFSTNFAFLKGFDRINGLSRNIRSTIAGELRTADERLNVSQSGSLFTESIRDDISLVFSRDQGVAAIARLVNNNSVNGTVTHDSTEGQAVFAVPSTAASVCYYESDKTAIYESGHMIRGGMTVQPSALPTGNGKITWGFGENVGGSNAINNAIAWELRSDGLYCVRIKNGSYVSAVKVTTGANRDRLDGSAGSLYRLAGSPVAHDPLKNGIYEQEFEWYGIAPPTYSTTAPYGLPIEVHVEETTGQQTGTTVPEPRLPMFIRIANDTTSGQVLSVRTGSWRGGINTNKTLLQSADSGGTGQQDVTLTATVLPITAGRTSIRLKNMLSSARPLFFGFSSGVTVLTGDELGAGEAIDLDLGERGSIYVVTTSTAGAGVRCSWTELV